MIIKLTQAVVQKLALTSGSRAEYRDTLISGFLLRIGPRGKFYYICYRMRNGKRHTQKIGNAEVLSLAQARDAAKEILSQVVLGNDPCHDASNKADDLTLSEFCNIHYLPWVRQNQKSWKTTTYALNTELYSLENVKVGSLTVDLIEKRREEMKSRGNKATTILRREGVLRAALNWGVRRKLLSCNPLAELERIKVLDAKEIVRYLTEEEEQRLYTALHKRDQQIRKGRESYAKWLKDRGRDAPLKQGSYVDYLEPMIILSLKTGIRRGAMFHLEWRDVDFDNRVITVRAEICKNGKMRRIPLSETAYNTLLKWREQCSSEGIIFPSPQTGKELDNVSTSWGNLMKAAKIENFRWHDMRHTFASRLVMAGVDLNTVRELMGHGDLKMTLRYAHLSPSIKSRAINLLG